MDIDTEAKAYTITQLSDRSSSNERNTFKNAKLFGKTILTVSLAFWLIILLIAIVGVIPLTQLIVGSLYKNACPINHLIPIYLIVAGVVGLVLVIIYMLLAVSTDIGCWLCFYTLFALFGLFNFAWLITGSVWVFRANSIVQFNNPDAKNTYCHKTLFDCAFVTIIITYVLAGLQACYQRAT